MAKAAVCSLLTVVCFVFFFLIFLPRDEHGISNERLRTGRRLVLKPPPPFDPLVAKIDRLAHEKAQQSNPTTALGPIISDVDHMGLEEQEGYEDFFLEEGKLNTAMRLKFLFPMLDTAPKDGLISLEELQTWMIQQTQDNLSYRTAKELRLYDKDGDGAVSFSEYLPKFSKEDIEKNETEHGAAGWWMQQFVNADSDHNGSLELEEFKNFLHPEDSKNQDIQRWVLKERIAGIDYNGDGKLDYTEFVEHAYKIYKGFAEFETEGGYVAAPQLLFAELDRSKDRLLAVDELRPLLSYLQPGELAYAKHYANFLLRQADENGDGRLSLEEMLKHEDTFYKAVYEEETDDYDDYHDEL